MAIALLREPVTRAKLAGLTPATAMAGVALALGPAPVVGADPGRAWFGGLPTRAAALCGALHTALSRPVLRRVPATLVTGIATLSATLLGALLPREAITVPFLTGLRRS